MLRLEAIEARSLAVRAGDRMTGSIPVTETKVAATSTIGAGVAAPGFTLPDLAGASVSLADLAGERTIILFWDPACAYCEQMLPALRAWEAVPPSDAPRLVMVSTGDVDQNRSLGLRASVLREPADRPVGRAFGAEGTPTAVLVDADGQITTPVAVGAPAVLTMLYPRAPSADEPIELTIGMATYNDFNGLYFTLQSLRLHQDLAHTELLVIDNYGCEDTRNLVESWLGARYIRATEITGTAAPRDLIFREARGEAVLCCDCHILFAPGAIGRLKEYYRDHPGCLDLLQGPLLYDDLRLVATHFDPVWRDQMWGTWGCDPRGVDPNEEPFEIPMQGLGVFSCRKNVWPGFHPGFRGFGGEEGYIHEKFRQMDGRCLCLPWLRWLHRFSRPGGVAYPLTVEDKLRNYVLGHSELGLDLAPVIQHFSLHLPEERVLAIVDETQTDERARLTMLASARPQVSVVMPVFNGGRYLRQAVRSVLRQTLEQIELIVVDDGSTDHTMEILAELAVDPRVRIIQQDHQGEPQARNRGIAEARAEYVAMHDADDISLPGRLAKQYAFLQDNPQLATVGAQPGIVDRGGQLIKTFSGVAHPQEIAALMPEVNCFIHGSVMARRSTLDAVGGYREVFAYASDYDLWLRLSEQAPLANLRDMLYLYRVHGDSMSSRDGGWMRMFGEIVQELADERRRTGADVLMRGGTTAFYKLYGPRLAETRTPIGAAAGSGSAGAN